MYEINRLIKMVQEEEPVRHNDTKLLFGERVRHEVGAEGVLIDSLHDNMLTSLYNKMKGIDTELYGEKAIEDSCDELSADMVRFESACESLSSYASNESVKLYSEAKKGNSIKLILMKILAFFKGIPQMIMRFFGKIAAMYRKLKVRSKYLVNRTEFFQSFNDNRLKALMENKKYNTDELKGKYNPWLEQHKDKLSKMKLTGDDFKDYKKILSYVVGYLPVKPYGLTKDGRGKVDDQLMNDIFGGSMVNALFNLASHAATMKDNNPYDDNGTISAIQALGSHIDAFPFLSVSSNTTQSAFDGTPLAGVHGLLSKHLIYVTQLTAALDYSLADALTLHKRKGDDNELDSKESVRKLVGATTKAADVADKLKASLTKPTTKSTKAKISDVLVHAIRLQQSLYAIILGDAQNLNYALVKNTYHDDEDGGAPGTIKNWGEVESIIQKTKGKSLGYASIIIEYKYMEIKSLIKVFEEYAPSHDKRNRDVIINLMGLKRGNIKSTTKNASLLYDQSVKVDEMVTDFIAGYDGNDNYVHDAINEFVRRSNMLHGATLNMSKVTTTLMELIGMANSYRMALIMDLTYRMQTVVDMFGLANIILADIKASVKDEVKSTNKQGSQHISGRIAFNS